MFDLGAISGWGCIKTLKLNCDNQWRARDKKNVLVMNRVTRVGYGTIRSCAHFSFLMNGH
jgi:hypothetical protein